MNHLLHYGANERTWKSIPALLATASCCTTVIAEFSWRYTTVVALGVDLPITRLTWHTVPACALKVCGWSGDRFRTDAESPSWSFHTFV